MMASRTDQNQKAIVAALRAAGYSVCCLHAAGHGGAPGTPDLLVGGADKTTGALCNWLLEVKAVGGRLTPAQWEWHAEWRGQVDVVRTVDDALMAVGAIEPATA